MESKQAIDYQRILTIGRELLEAIGENPDREGLQDTPRRFANWWKEFMEYDPGNVETCFESRSDSMVVVKGIRVWSLCEHHLLPFWADCTVAYIPDGKILGLSKFGRIAHQQAHQLQVQERLANAIADQISTVTESKNVAVVMEGEHLCMTMRGIKSPSIMQTSVMRGVFRDDSATRSEFFSLLNRGTR